MTAETVAGYVIGKHQDPKKTGHVVRLWTHDVYPTLSAAVNEMSSERLVPEFRVFELREVQS